jgi:DNA polymerase-3 subunit delta'
MAEQNTGWPVYGHRAAVDLLSRAVRTDEIAHAYLITGPSGIGRGLLARSFAGALACDAPAAQQPCGSCSACSRIARGTYPDVSLVSLESQVAGSGSAERKNTRISIETIRELRSSISLRPLEGRWRIAIIEDADLLSRDAYDGLLKTLEEPPPFVVILLIAAEPEALPETIRSRCLHIPLGPLSRAEITEALIAHGTSAEQAMVIASISRGRMAHALDLAGDPERLESRREAVEGSLQMIEDPLTALGGARHLADTFRRGQREKVQAEIDLLLGLWRDLLMTAAGCPEQIVNVDVADRITKLAGRWGLPEIQTGLNATYQTMIDLSANVQPRLALDHMVTQWPGSR